MVRRLLGSEQGQAMPLSLFLLLAFMLLVFGVMGTEMGIATRIELQGAADAGTRAAAAAAQPYMDLTVTMHRVSCSQADAQGPPSCSDGTPNTVDVEGFWGELFGAGGSPPGWAAKAGCVAVRQDTQTDGDLVCTGWHLEAWGWQFPPGTHPTGTAVSWLDRNTAKLTASGKTTVQVLDASAASDGTGSIWMRVRATEPLNPLGLVIGQPVTVTVTSQAQPKLSAPLSPSGS